MEYFLENWLWIILAIEFGIITTVVAYFATRDILRQHRVQYERDYLSRSVDQLESKIIDLNEKIHLGNIKYLESKKEWLENVYNISLTHKASVFQVKQDIIKIEQQIEKLKSK